MTSPFENTIYNFTSPQGILRDHLRSSLLAYQTQSMLGRFNGSSGSFRRPRARSHPKDCMSLLETYAHGPPTYPSYLEDTIYALLVGEQYKHYCRKYGAVNRNRKIGNSNSNSNNNNSSNNSSGGSNNSSNEINKTSTTSRLLTHRSHPLTNITSQFDTRSNPRNRNTFTNNNTTSATSTNTRRNNRLGARNQYETSDSSSSSSSSSSASSSSTTARSVFFEEIDTVDKASSPESSTIDPSHMSCTSPLHFAPFGSLRYNSYLAKLESQDLRLPTAWSSAEQGSCLDIGKKDNEIIYKGSGIEGDASSVRTNYWVKPQCGLFYYEVKIEASDDENSDGHISIGFCDEYSRLDRLPGSDDYSWGYHGENGYLTGGRSSLSNTTRKYGACFGIGDTIGCGIDFSDKTIFYTRNGIHLGTAFRDVHGKRIYPTVGFKTYGEKVTANFGQHTSFVFDIHQYRNDVAQRIVHHVMTSTPLPSANEKTDDQQPLQKRPRKKSTLVDQLVVNYLNHAGYVDTFTAMKKEMSNGMDEQDHAICEKVKMRQDICTALRNGQIDQVFIKCEQHYPDMLSGYPRILFRLQCQKFIALVESVMPQQKQMSLSSTNMENAEYVGKQKQTGDKRSRSILEMDDNATGNVDATKPTGVVAMTDQEMDDHDEDDDDDDDIGYYWRDLQIVMDYGQYLQQAYGSNKMATTAATTVEATTTTTTTTTAPDERSIRQIMECDTPVEEQDIAGIGMKGTLADIDVASELKATFSILAYIQPSDNPNAYLSGPKWREGIASELNAAMLVTEGEHPQSSLERLYRQTSVAMHELVLNGNGEASMVPMMDSLL